MASIPYPPWSAPSTLERENKPRWKNWFRKSGRKNKKETSSPTHQVPNSLMEDRFNMNPFVPRPSPFSRPFAGNPFSPLANYNPGPKRQVETDYTSSEDTQSGKVFDPDALIGKPTRPSLANVFPMNNTSVQNRPVPLIHISSPPHSPRRHSVSTPIPTALQPYITPDQRPLRTSAPSDPTSDPRYNRRERRAEALRQLPVLPNLQQQHKANIYSSPYKQPAHPVLINSFSFPPWPQPHEQLQELEEELEEDEVDGQGDPPYSEPPAVQRQRKIKNVHRGVVTNEQKKIKKKLQKLTRDTDSSDDNVKGFDSFILY